MITTWFMPMEDVLQLRTTCGPGPLRDHLDELRYHMELPGNSAYYTALRGSLEQHGQLVPLHVGISDGLLRLLDGHHRSAIAVLDLGWSGMTAELLTSADPHDHDARRAGVAYPRRSDTRSRKSSARVRG